MADSTITDALAEQITQPASFSEEGRSEAARPVGDMIKADQYIGSKSVAKNRRRGFAIAKFIPPGALADGGVAVPGPYALFGGGVG